MEINKKTLRNFSIRIEDELLRKFKIICIYEGRSVSRQIWYMIKCCIAEFERENGKIVLDKDAHKDQTEKAKEK